MPIDWNAAAERKAVQDWLDVLAERYEAGDDEREFRIIARAAIYGDQSWARGMPQAVFEAALKDFLGRQTCPGSSSR